MTWLAPILVVLCALMDGFYDKGKKFLSSIFKSLFIGGVAIIPVFAHNGGYMDIIYLLLWWWILFDVVYNITRRISLFYVGRTKWTDKLLRWLCDTNSATRTHYSHVSFITKLMALVAAIGLCITMI